MEHIPTEPGAYAERPAKDRKAVVYENATQRGRFHVVLELQPEHSEPGPWHGGSRPYSGPDYSELQAMALGLLRENFGIVPDGDSVRNNLR